MLKEKEENYQIFHHTCKQCNNSFDSTSKRKVVNFCSEQCRQLNRRMVNGKNMSGKAGIDFIICPICNQHVKQITVKHAKMHGYNSQKDMKNKLGIELTCEAKKELSKGENNPGYQHNGKFSPFSEKFNGYKGLTTEEKQIKIDSLVDGSITKRVSEKNGPVYPEYWIRQGYSEEEAQQKVSEQQTTFNLEICIEKYGKEEGLKRWNERQEKWSKSFKKQNFSKISQELFDDILNNVKLDLSQVYYATYDREDMVEYQNKEYVLKLEKSYIRPDFIILDKKKIIEFDGEYWHGQRDPNNIREAARDTKIIKEGYTILHVKEVDYKQNKQKVIEECISFLTK